MVAQVHIWSLQKRPEFEQVFGPKDGAEEALPPRARQQEPQQQVYLRFRGGKGDTAKGDTA